MRWRGKAQAQQGGRQLFALTHEECRRGRPALVSLGRHLGKPALQQADVGAEMGQGVVLVSRVQFPQRPQEPTEGPSVRTRTETAQDTEPAGHFTQFPTQVAQAAEDVMEQLPGLVGAAGLQRVVDRFLDQVQAGGVFRKVPPGPAHQAHQLLADQIVPGVPLQRRGQPIKVVAHRGVDRERAVGLTENQVPAHESVEPLPKFLDTEGGQRPGQGAFLLIQPAQFPHAPQGKMLAGQPPQLLLGFAPKVRDVSRGGVVAGELPR